MEVIFGKVSEFLGNCVTNSIASFAESKITSLVGNTVDSYFCGRDKLDELQQAMELIQAWLYDAERLINDKEEDKTIQVWLKRLKRLLYRLEDLFDLVTLANQQDDQTPPTKLRKSVTNFFTKNATIAREAEDIIKEFESLKATMDRLVIEVPFPKAQNAPNMREETHPFILEKVIIGRDDDRETIVDMLLDPNLENEVLTVIPIVGMGGFGKTTLAKFVYNDPRVQQFFELKSWTCISDQISSFDDLARKVLQSLTGDDCHQFGTQKLVSHLIKAVRGIKFFMVLDDVWDEDFKRWDDLRQALSQGKPGSAILVTTRSRTTCRNMGNKKPHELKGLSNDQSWSLFKAVAFWEGEEETSPGLASIGKEILNKCGNNPLAIRTIAGLLRSRNSEEEWAYFRDKEIGMIEQQESDILPTLKLSYNNLRPCQKQCFAYCSLFPKDHEYDVEGLIWLWMANGFVKSSADGWACCKELVRKCLFEVKDERSWSSFKMHDLMHELAQNVADEFVLLADKQSKTIDDHIVHVHVIEIYDSPSVALNLFEGSHLRSYLLSSGCYGYNFTSVLEDVCSSFLQLRALDVRDVSSMFGQGSERLPKSIGNLQHLRYLKVSLNACELPEEITSLQFLQTLDLEGSYCLKNLPKGFIKLTNLRNLKLGQHTDIAEMPAEFQELVHLATLDVFVVGENNGLHALSKMKLTGELQIRYKKYRQDSILEAELANLEDKELTALTMDFSRSDFSGASITEINELFARLRPPPTLKKLVVNCSEGLRFPKWVSKDKLPKLNELRISNGERCQYLPHFGGLGHLKMLRIENCDKLDLHDDRDLLDWLCLRSLSRLSLERMSKLETLPVGIFSLSSLRELEIRNLPNLKTISESIGDLTQLDQFGIFFCDNLEALPNSIQNLPLKCLQIRFCKKLEERIRGNEDQRGLVRHIPRLTIDELSLERFICGNSKRNGSIEINPHPLRTSWPYNPVQLQLPRQFKEEWINRNQPSSSS